MSRRVLLSSCVQLRVEVGVRVRVGRSRAKHQGKIVQEGFSVELCSVKGQGRTGDRGQGDGDRGPGTSQRQKAAPNLQI